MIERSICYLIRDVRELGRLWVIREEDRVQRCEGYMKEESGGMNVERFICERENFAFDSLIYLEPVER